MPRWPDMDDSKRCTATSNRTGRRCARARMPGATVCSKHGAAAPQVRDAAAARVADAQAREIAARVDVDLTQFHGDPIEALRDLLARDQAQMERFGRLVDRFEDSQLVYTTKGGVEMLRAVLSAYQQERDSLSRRLDLMLKAGVAERLIQTREAQTKVGQQGTAALFGFCLTLFLSDVSSAWSIDHCESGDGWKYSAVLPAIRRSLAELMAKGLVTNGGDLPGSRAYLTGMKGRPTIWEITDAGREYLARRAGTPAEQEARYGVASGDTGPA